MAWRALMRRCPSRSMTLVGDVAQTSDLAGTTSWDDALAPYVADRWRMSELTVNYRTPSEIMDVAAEVLREIDPTLGVPTSIRAAATQPAPTGRRHRGRLSATRSTRSSRQVGDGRLAVLAPEAGLD